MQFGCLAFEEIIQVSDQPVAPSFGRTVCTFVLASALMVLAITCQVVPITEVPDSKSCAPVTLLGFHISRLAPQPCGIPYIWPPTEFQLPFFRKLETVE